MLSPYSFRPASAGDLPQLGGWLRAPEVARWWGDPRDELELLRADLSEPRMTMRIVSFRGRAFAYAQDYEVHAWPQGHLAHLPQGSRAIDSFIGIEAMIGRGHGAAYLRLLARRLCEGAPLVAIDPAGFRPFAALQDPPCERAESARKRSSAEGVGLRQHRPWGK
jgi:aminoglycoside 6'-N-acetyltransferase